QVGPPIPAAEGQRTDHGARNDPRVSVRDPKDVLARCIPVFDAEHRAASYVSGEQRGRRSPRARLGYRDVGSGARDPWDGGGNGDLMMWSDFAVAAPELAAIGQQRIEATGLVVIGTLRRDGSPRISPVEPF